MEIGMMIGTSMKIEPRTAIGAGRIIRIDTTPRIDAGMRMPIPIAPAHPMEG